MPFLSKWSKDGKKWAENNLFYTYEDILSERNNIGGEKMNNFRIWMEFRDQITIEIQYQRTLQIYSHKNLSIRLTAKVGVTVKRQLEGNFSFGMKSKVFLNSECYLQEW